MPALVIHRCMDSTGDLIGISRVGHLEDLGVLVVEFGIRALNLVDHAQQFLLHVGLPLLADPFGVHEPHD